MNKITLALLPITLALALTACSQEKDYVFVGPNWATLYQAKPDNDHFPVTMKANDNASLGDKLSLSIHSGRDGYLWLLQVDPNDTVSVLYPNQFIKDNHIAADQWQTIPGQGQNWNIEAMQPVGDSLLVAIVTTQPGDLNIVWGALKSPQGSAEKTLGVVSEKAALGLAKQVITIKE